MGAGYPSLGGVAVASALCGGVGLVIGCGFVVYLGIAKVRRSGGGISVGLFGENSNGCSFVGTVCGGCGASDLMRCGTLGCAGCSVPFLGRGNRWRLRHYGFFGTLPKMNSGKTVKTTSICFTR